MSAGRGQRLHREPPPPAPGLPPSRSGVCVTVCGLLSWPSRETSRGWHSTHTEGAGGEVHARLTIICFISDRRFIFQTHFESDGSKMQRTLTPAWELAVRRWQNRVLTQTFSSLVLYSFQHLTFLSLGRTRTRNTEPTAEPCMCAEWSTTRLGAWRGQTAQCESGPSMGWEEDQPTSGMLTRV